MRQCLRSGSETSRKMRTVLERGALHNWSPARACATAIYFAMLPQELFESVENVYAHHLDALYDLDYIMAGRGVWRPKLSLDEEIAMRRTSQVVRRAYAHGRWSEDDMRIVTANKSVDVSGVRAGDGELMTLEEFINNRIWLCANGHCSGNVRVEDVNLTNAGRMPVGTVLETRANLWRLLKLMRCQSSQTTAGCVQIRHLSLR
eukprot:5058364-Amphidinium_carterae.1